MSHVFKSNRSHLLNDTTIAHWKLFVIMPPAVLQQYTLPSNCFDMYHHCCLSLYISTDLFQSNASFKRSCKYCFSMCHLQVPLYDANAPPYWVRCQNSLVTMVFDTTNMPALIEDTRPTPAEYGNNRNLIAEEVD